MVPSSILSCVSLVCLVLRSKKLEKLFLGQIAIAEARIPAYLDVPICPLTYLPPEPPWKYLNYGNCKTTLIRL